MRATKVQTCLFLAGLLLTPLQASTAPLPPPTGQNPLMLTKLAFDFHQLELGLSSALLWRDQPAIDKLLSPDFELRIAGDGTDVELIARGDWLASRASAHGGDMWSLAVHEHGDIAIASFVRTRASDEASDPAERHYIVDVWKKNGGGWQLLTRYQSNLPPAEATQTDVAPTGKG